jgi:hypothetical protein
VVGCGISAAEQLASVPTVNKMDLMATGCEDKIWMELAQSHVQWQALVLAALNFWALLSWN